MAHIAERRAAVSNGDLVTFTIIVAAFWVCAALLVYWRQK